MKRGDIEQALETLLWADLDSFSDDKSVNDKLSVNLRISRVILSLKVDRYSQKGYCTIVYRAYFKQ